jgi:hypothetical protein
MTRTSDGSRALGLVLLVVTCLLLPGCKSKITKANFDKIQDGMTLEEVEGILGKGESQTGDPSVMLGQAGVALPMQSGQSKDQVYVWESGNKKITIVFRQDKVVKRIPSGL